MSLNDSWECVRDFHEKFGHPYNSQPRLVDPFRAQLRASWMSEEIMEFTDATNITDQADAMIDLIYFALGTLVEMGVRPDNLFRIVHDANMKKLWHDGTHRKDGNGKTIKPASWKDPHNALALEIERQQKK